MSELAEIDITSDSPEAVDLREARSFRYTDALRIVPLESGRFALWGMADGRLEIMDGAGLTPEHLRARFVEQKDYEARVRASIKPRTTGPLPPKPSPSAKPSPVSFEDLFGAKGGQKGP